MMGEKGEKGEKEQSVEPDGADLSIAVVVSRFNQDISRRLLRGALEALQEHGVEEPDVFWVPGSLELPVTTLTLAEKGGYDAIVCLGCVIRGETYHFEIVANQAAAGIMQVQLDTGVPVTFGVITTEDREQALARSGPKNNKGGEAAEAAVEMANLLHAIQG
ncbi:MAG: 6,7-dimethyl-8-ribityllumazine synthase [Candidatus Dormibacteraceae bacterium]